MALAIPTRRWLLTSGLIILLLAAVAGLILTRDLGDAARPRSSWANLVDQRALQMARAMATLASSRDEQRYARQALKIADHEVDLAFSTALRDAAEETPNQTPQTREISERVDKAQAALKADQDHADQLKKLVASTTGARQDSLQQQLSLLQAQLELDQDELEDAQEDQLRAGANKLSRIQRLFARHQTDEQQQEAAAAQLNASQASNAPTGDNLIVQVRAWAALYNKQKQLEQANAGAAARAAALQQTHDALQQRVNAETPNKQALALRARAQVDSANPPDQPAAPAPTSTIASLRRFANDQKDLSDLGKQIQDSKELADVYTNWMSAVAFQQRAAIHGTIRALLWIVLIVLAVYEAGRLIDRALFADLTPDHRRLRTLRVVVRFALQAVGILAIVFVVMGMPTQIATILGLAGAGLTVALKDFIVAFVGWFILMGRNGIRVGDWVEIEGVVGEVAEINLLRTVLLETGNWTDTGHPTGRKVAFVNSYAIEGHFFNFSTAGQWLWDEIEFLVPASEDPYPVIEGIQAMVTKETETNARMAEQEWKHATNQYKVQSVSAAPAVNLRPTSAGVEVHVRYITRAQERFATRTHLYQALIDLLHRKSMPGAAENALAAKS
ncbi:MAG TPA: mechanosensitive ion channel domain-containing protein [Terriglobales bacterium]|nr:mechanosensitive ion channel domain-containing protein [Terriglobales bacterium]